MKLKSLDRLSFDELYSSFAEAFIDYDVQFSDKELELMLDRRGFDAKLSFGFFDDDKKLVAFTFNGVGDYKGKLTAYDTGTGTIQDYRGKGLAGKIFEASLPYLEAAGIKQYLLEVLQHNDKAISVYLKQGFEITREFYYFRDKTENITFCKKALAPEYSMKPIKLDEASMSSFWDFEPSWQNSFESIHRQFYDFVILGAHTNDELVGYCIFEPTTGDVTQIAVNVAHRRKGVATALLKEAVKHNESDSIKVINTEIPCNSITHFLESQGMKSVGKQYEMIKNLN